MGAAGASTLQRMGRAGVPGPCSSPPPSTMGGAHRKGGQTRGVKKMVTHGRVLCVVEERAPGGALV